MLQPEAAQESLSQVSGPSREPRPLEFLGAAAWVHDGTLGTGVNCDYGPSFTEGTLSEAQMALCREVAPSQARGEAPVPAQPLSLVKHPRASDATPILQPRSASSQGPPRSRLEAANRIAGLQVGSVVGGATHQTLAPGAIEGAWDESAMALTGARCCSQGMVAPSMFSRSSQLAPGRVHLESVARMGSPGLPRRSGAASMVSHVQPYQSWTKLATSALPQGEAAPGAPQKPTSRDWTQSIPTHLPGTRKSYKSCQGSLVPELLEGAAAGLGPLQWARIPASGSPPHSPRLAAGLLSVGVSQDKSVPSLSPGVQGMSLGYKSPTASRRPLFDQTSHYLSGPTARHRKLSLTLSVPQGQLPHRFTCPTVSRRKPSLTPGVPQGPANAGTRGGQPWNSAVPSVAVRPLNRAVAPHSPWQLARAPGPWDSMGREVAAEPRPPEELTVSLQHIERIIVHAVTIIQAWARGFLVRRTIKVWHQRATVIQATWRGHRMRRNLARLYRATTVIQAAWRGHCVRRACAQQMHFPTAWAEPGREAKMATEHRCFQSCQPRACSLCRSLSPRPGNPPSVVMLVGASPRTCHTCGHTQPTRVVHGTGRAGAPRARSSQLAPQGPREPWDEAATTIQSAWKGFKVRSQLREHHSAAKTLQATWRGHYTRSCLTPEALLGTGSPWESAPGASRRGSHQPSGRPGA